MRMAHLCRCHRLPASVKPNVVTGSLECDICENTKGKEFSLQKTTTKKREQESTGGTREVTIIEKKKQEEECAAFEASISVLIFLFLLRTRAGLRRHLNAPFSFLPACVHV